MHGSGEEGHDAASCDHCSQLSEEERDELEALASRFEETQTIVTRLFEFGADRSVRMDGTAVFGMATMSLFAVAADQLQGSLAELTLHFDGAGVVVDMRACLECSRLIIKLRETAIAYFQALFAKNGIRVPPPPDAH